jgi:hypothetical protein
MNRKSLWTAVCLAGTCALGVGAGSQQSAGLDLVPSSGPAEAPVVLVEYFRYGCGNCLAMQPVLEDLKTRYPQSTAHRLQALWPCTNPRFRTRGSGRAGRRPTGCVRRDAREALRKPNEIRRCAARRVCP